MTRISMILAVLPLLVASLASAQAVDSTSTEQEKITPYNISLSILSIVGKSVKEVDQQEENTLTMGLGVLVEMPWTAMGEMLSLESGAIYHKRLYRNSRGGLTLIQESTRLHVPVMARFWAADFFSIGLGPYLSAQIGDARSMTIGNVPFGELDTSADNDLELGLDAAATFNFHLNQRTGLFIEARYIYPFGKESGEQADALTGLLGVKIDL